MPRTARLLLLALLSIGPVAQAQIRIGQTAGFTGPVAAGVKETTDGARLWFDAVNARGGIAGQKIELVSLDDRFDPKLAGENARTLAADARVISLFLTRGTPHAQAILPVLQEAKLPLVGPSTGAMVLHEPVQPWVYNVRATYQREAERAVMHLATVGITRIAVIQVDDSFGADCMVGAQRGFKAAGVAPVAHETFDRAKPDYTALAPKVAGLQPQAVLFFGSGSAVADGIAALRRAGSRAQLVTLSNNASSGFVKLLGDHARGTIVMQVFPFERSLATRFVQEAQELAKAAGLPELTPAMLEGFAAARVMAEALRRAAPNPTREKLRTALDGMGSFDIGGLEVSFSPRDHTGLTYVDISIIGADGRFKR
ncbi:MAG: ABC transporter substrate-binding protein [Rubrivivax sp.]|nr:ABC transporter substrate-binding protein [Rubrivivax sp.]